MKHFIVIDMQNDFCTGALANKDAVAVIPRIKAELQAAKAEKANIIFTRDTHSEDYLETGEGKHLPVKHCVKDTEGWQVVPELMEETDEDTLFIDKLHFGYDGWKEFIKEGDEVIVPAYTYTATASAAIHCGATVKFVDIQKDGDSFMHMPEIDYDTLESMISEKTKAIIAVDLAGIVCDYEKLFAVADSKRAIFKPLKSDGSPLGDLSSRIQNSLGRIAVVCDAAHALGASRIIKGKRRYVGNIADFTSFSFHAVKNFTTAEGGAATWHTFDGVDNKEIYKFYQLLSLHGQNKDALAKTKVGAWEYDIIGPWYKCNMTDIMAAIGLKQLDRYQGLLERRKEIIKQYDKTCDELGIFHLVHHTDYMDSSKHLYLIRIPGIDVEIRNLIIEKMAEFGVATNVHYKPLPMMTAYGNNCSDYPNAFDYYKNLITLPLHTLLSDEDVEYICCVFKDVISEVC